MKQLPHSFFENNDARALSLKTYFSLRLLEKNRVAVFEAITYFAFSLPEISNRLSDRLEHGLKL